MVNAWNDLSLKVRAEERVDMFQLHVGKGGYVSITWIHWRESGMGILACVHARDSSLHVDG